MKNRHRDRDGGERKRFEYKRRDPASVKAQANQKGGSRDGFIKPQFPVFTTKAGETYRIRILPATWEDSASYSYPIEVHYGVGADNNQYACLAKMKEEKCPVCEERSELLKHRRNKEADDAKPKTRKAMWIIDRDHEEDGPKIWTPSWTWDRDIAAEAEDAESGETVYYDDPYKGRDVIFKIVKKKGEMTDIKGIKCGSRDTPLHRNEKTMQKWLAFVAKHPLPDCIEFHEAEHIEKMLVGGIGFKRRNDEEEGDGERPRTRRDRDRGRDDDDYEEDDRRSSRRRSFRDDDEPDDDDDDLDGDEPDVDDDDDAADDDRRSSRHKRRRSASDADDDVDDDEGDDDGEVDEGGDEDESEDSSRHERHKRKSHESSGRRKEKGLKRRRQRFDDADIPF